MIYFYSATSRNGRASNILLDKFEKILERIEDIEVRGIDLALLERYTQAINNCSSVAMLDILIETRMRLLDHLKQPFKGFRTYILQPCPLTK